MPDEIVPYWQQKQLSNKYDASLPWIIIPRQAQAEVVEYIQQMPVQANVYYPEIYKVAEIPPQTGRIHYPIRRRQHATVTSHPADVLLFSPPIISPWRNAPVPRGEVLKLVEQVCPKPVVSNDFYRICVIEEMDTLP